MDSGFNFTCPFCPNDSNRWVLANEKALYDHMSFHKTDIFMTQVRGDRNPESEIRSTSSTGGQKGVKLARFDLLPANALIEVAEHYGRGAMKYDAHQWRKGYEWSKSIAAIGRHWADILAGRDYDVCPENGDGCSHVTQNGESFPGEETPNGRTCYNHTGSHHAAAIVWHGFLLLEFKDTHPDHDDRYKNG